MKIALLLVVLVGAASAVPRRQQRIVGGENATVAQYPYIAAMLFAWLSTGTHTQACGGSLITHSSVLSAAHCYHGDQTFNWRIRTNSNFGNSGGTVHLVSNILNHPQYNDNTLNNDVSILRMATPAAANLIPALIAGPNYMLQDHTAVNTAGWGALWAGGPASAQLQHVQINIINQQLCAQRYAFLKTQPGYQNWPDITPGMICAGILDYGGRDACQGDSGGPLAHAGNVIVGITSWGFGCADAFYPGVSARVSFYSNWIVANG